ncbi:hypothetical protein Scep_012633 [Stephania cephalantha]|uniref:Uncharacterized protein n=1 Tax=Stephania cephalantha TaxID=152367 RepID=A0AAP0P9R1_9MAGN
MRRENNPHQKRSIGDKEGVGDGEEETSGEGESEGSDKGEEEGHGERESEGSKEGSREEDSEESSGGEEKGNGEGEEEGEGESSEGADEDEEERTHDKARGKRASSSSRVVEEATDDPSRPISGGPTDRSILATVDIVQKWKTLSASESTMTSAEKMADDVLRHMTGKGSSISNAFEEGTQSGSHAVGYAFGPSKRKHSSTDHPPKKHTKGMK